MSHYISAYAISEEFNLIATLSCKAVESRIVTFISYGSVTS